MTLALVITAIVIGCQYSEAERHLLSSARFAGMEHGSKLLLIYYSGDDA